MTEFLAFFQALDLSWLWSIVQVMQSLGIFWPTVKFGLWVALFLWCFWVLYVATMAVYRLKLAGVLDLVTTSKFTLALCYSLVLIAVLVDVIAQYTVAMVVFREAPKKGEHLVTDRLQRYMALEVPTWRTARADWICRHVLDLFDPLENHCNRRSAP